MDCLVARCKAIILLNEFVGSILRARHGLTVDADALAVEVIASVMDGTRNYLGQKHTMKHLKAGDVALTKLAERGNWEAWERGGKQSILERAQAEAERILREHQVQPLEAAQEQELDELLAAAGKELK
jgi:trimethylamine---corrinoid protein Co-methyltransferase